MVLILAIWLPSLLFGAISSKDWTQQLLQKHDIYKEKEVIFLDISTEEIDHYPFLQQVIAEKIPKESKRPTISLHVEGVSTSTQKIDVAILGGMGPLSDARILQLVSKKLEKEGLLEFLSLDLLSAPPPRDLGDLFGQGTFYFRNLYRFLQKNYDYQYLASNTAHLYFDWLNFFSKTSFVNLTRFVAEKVKDCRQDPFVLILGTTAAKKENLYGKMLDDLGVKYAHVSKTAQKVIQQEIDRIKSGHLADERLLKVISQELFQSNANTLLLACTELPIGLAGKEDFFDQLGISVLDSEQLFAEKISLDIRHYWALDRTRTAVPRPKFCPYGVEEFEKSVESSSF